MYFSNAIMVWMFSENAIQIVLLSLIKTRISRVMQFVDTMTIHQVFQLKDVPRCGRNTCGQL
jgi:hypothetical protein